MYASSVYLDDLAVEVPDIFESVQVAKADRHDEQDEPHHVVPVHVHRARPVVV